MKQLVLPPKTGVYAKGNGWCWWCNGCRTLGYALLERDAKRKAKEHQAKCPEEDERR